MKRNVLGKYDILVERGVLSGCGESIAKVARGTKCAILTDDNVAPLYADTVKASLEQQGFTCSVFVFPHGEEHKTVDTVLQMVDFLAKEGLTRIDTVIALGGGVVGDMAGFAAAMYLRGIDFVQIPTTLLAQIDSSVGGKTGCDLPVGKNLVGAFHHPSLVLVDPDTLNTLPMEYKIDGMGEAIKYGCIRSAALFEQLENSEPFAQLDQMIFECIGIKADIVENDFTEQGERALLNFGHTLGHAIEKLERFQGLSHGCAVSVGMNLVAQACEANGLCPAGSAGRLQALCEKYGLPTATDLDIDTVCEAAGNDKKRAGNQIKLIVMEQIGRCVIRPMAWDTLADFIKE